MSKQRLAIIPSGDNILTSGNSVEFGYTDIDQAFPPCDPGLKPFGTICLFQIRHPMRMTKGGIILTEDVRATEHYNTQVAKVIALGPLAFKTMNRDTGEVEDWDGGAWFKVGDFVRLPMHGGDRFTVPFKYKDFEYDEEGRKHLRTVNGKCVFTLFKASSVQGLITGDPLAVQAYLD